MNSKHRNNIIREVKRLLKQDETYSNLESGAREQLQDKYIEQVCKERGFDISHFYATDGKTLDKLLSTL